jgi:tetraacyldisaccharide 4'-kinase
VFPAGPLRAPLEPQLARAKAVVLVGVGANVLEPDLDVGLPVLRAWLEPDAASLTGVGPILAFAGIGRPQKFADTLATLGKAPKHFVAFPDHHRLSAAEAAALLDRAARENLTLVTTEKDLARLKGEPALAKLASSCRALPVRLRFENDAPLRRLLAGALGLGR